MCSCYCQLRLRFCQVYPEWVSCLSFKMYVWSSFSLLSMFLLWHWCIDFHACRKRMLPPVRSLSLWRPTSATWSLCLRWLGASSASTTARPSIRLRSSRRWLATTLQSSPSRTSQSSTVGPVSVLPTLRGSFLWSEGQMWASVLSVGFFFHVAWAAKLKHCIPTTM